MRKHFITICALLVFLTVSVLTSCADTSGEFMRATDKNQVQAESTTIAVSDDTSNNAELESEMFNRFYNTSGAQADSLLEQIICSIENRDASSLEELFSASAIRSAENIEVEIKALIDFFGGKLVSYKRYGPGTYSSKEGNSYLQEIEASFDVTTTSGNYRMAINFCTIDSANPENVGLYAIYIISAENSDMSFAYWGDDEWEPGITIEYEA